MSDTDEIDVRLPYKVLFTTQEMVDEIASLRKELAAVTEKEAEWRTRLIEYLDSPEGKNFMAAQQRDTANRVADELEAELAAVTAERDEALRRLAATEPKP